MAGGVPSFATYPGRLMGRDSVTEAEQVTSELQCKPKSSDLDCNLLSICRFNTGLFAGRAGMCQVEHPVQIISHAGR